MTKEELLKNIAAEIEKYECRFGMTNWDNSVGCVVTFLDKEEKQYGYNGEKFVEVKAE